MTELEDLLNQILGPGTDSVGSSVGSRTWKALADSGLTRVGLAEEFGGVGGELSDAVTVIVRAAQAGLDGPLTEALLMAGHLATSTGIALPQATLSVGIARLSWVGALPDHQLDIASTTAGDTTGCEHLWVIGRTARGGAALAQTHPDRPGLATVNSSVAALRSVPGRSIPSCSARWDAAPKSWGRCGPACTCRALHRRAHPVRPRPVQPPSGPTRPGRHGRRGRRRRNRGAIRDRPHHKVGGLPGRRGIAGDRGRQGADLDRGHQGRTVRAPTARRHGNDRRVSPAALHLSAVGLARRIRHRIHLVHPYCRTRPVSLRRRHLAGTDRPDQH